MKALHRMDRRTGVWLPGTHAHQGTRSPVHSPWRPLKLGAPSLWLCAHWTALPPLLRPRTDLNQSRTLKARAVLIVDTGSHAR